MGEDDIRIPATTRLHEWPKFYEAIFIINAGTGINLWKHKQLSQIMAYNEKMTNRVRAALAHLPKVEEKKMFRGIAFMVDGKMCISVGDTRMMCRIDPALHEAAVEKKGCHTVEMKGRPYKGYVYISEEGMKAKKDFDYWIGLSLDFNKRAKASPKKKKK